MCVVFVSACTLVCMRRKEKRRYDFMTSYIYLLVLDISTCSGTFDRCRKFNAQRCQNLRAEHL